MKPEKRAVLFAAATREFTEHGFKQASLNRIIDKVGMSKSSFYHFFSSKSELFEQIMVQTLAPLSTIVMRFEPENLNAQSYWPDITNAMGDISGILQGAPEIISVGRMFYRNLDDADGLCTKMMELLLALTTRFLQRGQTLGVIRQDLPLSLLISSVMALGMALDRWGLENFDNLDAAEFSRLNEKVMEMFMRILAP